MDYNTIQLFGVFSHIERNISSRTKERFEMWCGRRIQNNKFDIRVKKEEVLKRMEEWGGGLIL